MAKGKSWDIYERQLVARARVVATHNNFKSADQRQEIFSDQIGEIVKVIQPKGCEPFRLNNRGSRNLYSFLHDRVFPDVQKFIKSLIIVRASKPTGNPTESDMHCMAIAIHLKKATGIKYEYMSTGSKCFDPKHKWIFTRNFMCHNF